jgi:hypothetical protein
MMNIDFGPDWFYKLLLVLAAIGAIAGIYGVVKITIWLFHHLKFV